MDAIVTQVVLDRRGITDDFDQKLGISVNQLVSKLVDQDRLQLAIEDAKQARHELEIVNRVKSELELEVGQKDGMYFLVWISVRAMDTSKIQFDRLESIQ